MSGYAERARAAATSRLRPGTWQRRMAGAGYNSLRLAKGFGRDTREQWRVATAGATPRSYRSWKRDHAPDPALLAHQRLLADDALHGPQLVVVLVVDATDPSGPARARLTRASLDSQTWPTWTLREVGSLVDAAAELAGEGDPSDLVMIAEAGDRFRSDFVFSVVDAAWTDPEAVLVHWDDDVDGADPRFRPAWSPDTLLSGNYVGRSVAVRRAAMADAGGFDAAHGDDAWWDLLLRIDPPAANAIRLPAVLASLCRRPADTGPAATGIVDAALARRGLPARVERTPDGLRVRWDGIRRPRVTIVVPTRHNRALVGPCLRSVAASTYPDIEVVVVDNGERTPDNEAWYERFELDLTVQWWDRPFNYSAVNNAGVAAGSGEIVVLLNDDTIVLDPAWLDELVGWATTPGVGTVGVQLLDPDDRIQHGGVIMGIRGLADHMFPAMAPGTDTMFGPTTWYRNTSAVTGACVALTRENYERFGGLDERFELCGSDVVLGLDALRHGLRNVVTPHHLVRHLESATRGSDVPVDDLYASYWRYQRHVRAGDRYWSPNLSLRSGEPALRSVFEPDPVEWLSTTLDRQLVAFRQSSDEEETHGLVGEARLDEDDVAWGIEQHASVVGARPPTTINWFVPDLDSPFYGGIHTALRLADHLARHHGVTNRLVVWGRPDERWIRSGVAAAFPALADVEIVFIQGSDPSDLDAVPDADAAIATLWLTAFQLSRFRRATRRFYLVQDYEPMFYPAGSLYALAEETYRLGLYAVCNTDELRSICSDDYGGTAASFWPAVDRTLFTPVDRRPLDHDGPTTIFLYARPGHWRNCWEIARPALIGLKRELGEQVRIVTAGSWARPEDLGTGIDHLGQLDLSETADLYRRADIGIALTVSRHPSYLPLELMACGVPVVAFDNPAGHWVLHDDVNSRLCRRTPESLRAALSELVLDPAKRVRLGAEGEATIDRHHGDWHAVGERFAAILADPEACAVTGPPAGPGAVAG